MKNSERAAERLAERHEVLELARSRAGQLRYVVQAGNSAEQGQLTAQYRFDVPM